MIGNSDAYERPLRKAVAGISVVMPTRNAGPYLRLAVVSIIGQTFQNWELVIIDDHSSDDSISQLKDLHDNRIRIIKATESGLVSALNQGVLAARYPLIARMDSDDIAHPERLNLQYQYWLAHPNVDIVGARVKVFNDSTSVGEGYKLYEHWINQACSPSVIGEQLFIESPIPHPTALFCKNVFDHLHGYQDRGWPEDYDLWCRAFIAGMRFGKPRTEPLLRWRDHTNRTSRVDQAYTKHAFLRCKAYYLAIHLKSLGDKSFVSIWGAGPTGLKMAELLATQGIKIECFYDVNPKLSGATKRGVPVKVVHENSKMRADKLRPLCLVAVGSRGAREKIRAFLEKRHWVSGKDFICVT